MRTSRVACWACLGLSLLTSCASDQTQPGDSHPENTGTTGAVGGTAAIGGSVGDNTGLSRGGTTSKNGVVFGGAPAPGGSVDSAASTSEPLASGGASNNGFGSTTNRSTSTDKDASNGGGTSTGKATTSKAAGGKSAGGAPTSNRASGGSSGASKTVGEIGAGGKAAGGASNTRATSATKAAGGASFGRGGSSTLGETGGRPGGGAATGGAASSSATIPSGGTDSLCPTGITRTITVAKDGSGQFSTVQSAVDSIANGSTAHIRINIKAGTYAEKLTIANRTNLCLVGDGADKTILSYNDSNGSVGSTYGSASVWISANDFSAAQLTFRNSYGAGSQAVALRTTGLRQQFLNCRLVGYQDTLYVHSGTQYFRKCYVQGNTDYVFGGATAVLQDCEVRNVQSGSAVAAPNTASGTAYGIVFLGGQFTAASGVSNVALARPWGADGAAAFLNATLGGHISAAGFTSMSGNSPTNARFAEYQSTGAGANASRSAYQMTAAEAATYTIAKIYAGAWTPSYSQ
ncbi:MAG TPA: pectinesterase family protein [Polyangiaceae bacterium]|nr:pectinesterase family protein [Polyangiaceae bacterium]